MCQLSSRYLNTSLPPTPLPKSFPTILFALNTTPRHVIPCPATSQHNTSCHVKTLMPTCHNRNANPWPSQTATPSSCFQVHDQARLRLRIHGRFNMATSDFKSDPEVEANSVSNSVSESQSDSKSDSDSVSEPNPVRTHPTQTQTPSPWPSSSLWIRPRVHGRIRARV